MTKRGTVFSDVPSVKGGLCKGWRSNHRPRAELRPTAAAPAQHLGHTRLNAGFPAALGGASERQAPYFRIDSALACLVILTPPRTSHYQASGTACFVLTGVKWFTHAALRHPESMAYLVSPPPPQRGRTA